MLTSFSTPRIVSFENAYRRFLCIAGQPFDTIPAAPRTPLRRLAKGAELARGRPLLLASGWACEARRLEDGNRHIFGLLLPGDLVCTQADSGPPLSHVSALTTVETLEIPDGPHAGLLPPAAAGLAEARRLDQLLRLGGLSAPRAVGHLLLELHDRLESVGMTREGRFQLPIGQRVLAGVLGLSAVHVNRTLQHLSREQLAASGAGWAAICDRSRLRDLAGCPSSFEMLSAA